MPNFHFYLLGDDEMILQIIDLSLADDAAAAERASALLMRCHAVEVLRGPLPINRIDKVSCAEDRMIVRGGVGRRWTAVWPGIGEAWTTPCSSGRQGGAGSRSVKLDFAKPPASAPDAQACVAVQREHEMP